jgi:hypothetical protein
MSTGLYLDNCTALLQVIRYIRQLLASHGQLHDADASIFWFGRFGGSRHQSGPTFAAAARPISVNLGSTALT